MDNKEMWDSFNEAAEQYKSTQKYRKVMFFAMLFTIAVSAALLISGSVFAGLPVPLMILGIFPAALGIFFFVFMCGLSVKLGSLLAEFLVLAGLPDDEIRRTAEELKLNKKIVEKKISGKNT